MPLKVVVSERISPSTGITSYCAWGHVLLRLWIIGLRDVY